MKSFAPRFFSLVLAALVSAPLFTPALRAQDSAHYRGSPLGSKVRIDGSANIHDWKMEGTIIGGSFELPTGIELDSIKAGVTGLAGDQLAAKARVQIPVTSVQSGTEGMDSVMQQAMDAENHPEIIFQLTSLTLKGTHAADSPFEFEAKGDLSLHGVTNAV